MLDCLKLVKINHNLKTDPKKSHAQLIVAAKTLPKYNFHFLFFYKAVCVT